jgi:uncharacterized membrane protein YbhN (UPF0104 family)
MPDKRPHLRERAFRLLKLLAPPLALVALVAALIGGTSGLGTLPRFAWGYVALAVVALLCVHVLNGLRWYLLARRLRLPLGPVRAIAYQIEGQFFAFLAPGGLGGDVSRAGRLTRLSGDMDSTVATVLVSRLMALAATAVTAFAAIVTGIADTEQLGPASVASIGVAALLGVTSVWWLPAVTVRFPGQWARRLTHALRSFEAPELIAGGVLTAAAQVIGVLLYYLIIRSFGLSLGLVPVLAVTVMSSVASLAPTVGNGAGVREAGMYATLLAFGAPSAIAAGVGVANLLIQVAVSLLGGLVSVLDRAPRGGEASAPGTSREET